MTLTWKQLLAPAAGLVLTAVVLTNSRETAEAAAPPRVADASPNAGSATRITAEGRLVTYPGAEVTVGSDLAGTLARVAVAEKEVVRKGQLIAELRADDLRAELAEAKARIGESEADLRLYEIEVARAERLAAAGVEPAENADRQRRNREAASARLATAQAVARRIAAVLDKTRLLAPISGVVTAKLAESGETIAAGASIVTLADLTRVRVEAEVDEFDAAKIAVGAGVTVSAEGHAETWSGRVEEVPDAVVGRRLKPQDPGRPQDPRVLLVKVALDQTTPLKLGQRVEVAIAGQ